ncbi:MAG: DUF1203 domain-containing protein [Lysobacter sp.]|nr:DUF1203 domain-containing protein [Lysobacter sp.]
MDYIIRGLPLESFRPLFGLDAARLQQGGIERRIADAKPGFPCRVTLQDAEPGESLLLLPFEHHPVDSPYRSSGPIFVRESAQASVAVRNHIPEQQQARLLSVRAYDKEGSMRDAEVVEGSDLEMLIVRFFADSRVSYLHVHNARRGCYACLVDRGRG